MDIIAHNGAVVKVYINNHAAKSAVLRTASKQRRAAIMADKIKPIKVRWTEHKRLAVAVGERLIKAGLEKRGQNIKMCGNQIVFRECRDCGHMVIERAMLCRDRLCPVCNWRLALKRYSTMQQIMDVVLQRIPEGIDMALMTLTVRNCAPEEISEHLSKMQRAWNRMLAQRYIRPHVMGWARSIEVTYNEQTHTLHPHYHIIMLAPTLAQETIRADWLKQCRTEGLEVDIKAQHAQQIDGARTEGDTLIKSILECYKYMVKASDTIAMPLGVLRHFAAGVAGKRLVSFGGIIKDVARELGEVQLDSPDALDQDIIVCTRCKSTELDRVIADWSFAGNHYQSISQPDTSIYHVETWDA